MTILKATAAGLAASAGLFLPSLAAAADYDLPPISDLPPVYEMPLYEAPPEIKPVEIGNGWYLRGDVGYAFRSSMDNTVRVRTPFVSDVRFGDHDIAGQAEFQIGGGYQFTDWFRADATFGIAKFDSDAIISPLLGNAVVFDPDGYRYEAMANVYLDLGTFAGFTPYVGAGAGGVQIDYDSDCRVTETICRFDDDSDWRFAYSLLAGLGYDISRNLTLDVGYRFLDVDGGQVASVHLSDSPFGLLDGSGTISDHGFQSHSIRAGLRYSLW